MVVYDEIEHFPKDVRNTRFTYPFIDQKTVVNKVAVRYDGDEVLQQILNLKRSTVCLEPSILSGLDLITHGKAAFAQFLGTYNETASEISTDPCKAPAGGSLNGYKKIKLGGHDWRRVKAKRDANGKINKYDFLEIELHNDPVKLTVQRSSMQILAFFGAIGGMQRFVGAILGKIGGYFSAKFFGAKLMTDLYIQKKNKS